MGRVGRESRQTESVPRSTPKQRRLGRPPATDSAETRRRIVATARETFAVHGFEVTTNRDIATRSGVTPAALYHYFPSKSDLYVAVVEDTQSIVSAHFTRAVATRDAESPRREAGFVDRFEAILDAAHELNREDPSYARFLGAVQVDSRRHPEMAGALFDAQLPVRKFIVELVEEAITRGDIERTKRGLVLSFLATTLTGLTDESSGDERRHRMAIDAAKAAVRGSLFGPAR